MQKYMRDNRLIVRGILCAAIGGVSWGFSGTCAQMLMSVYGIPIFWLTPLRLLGSSVCFLLIAVLRQRKELCACLADTSSLGKITLFALAGVLLTQISYLSCISYTNSGIGTVMERTGLIWIMLISSIRMHSLPSKKEFLGLIMALAGVFLIATQGDISHLAIPLAGLLFGLVNGVSFAGYTLLPVQVLKKWGPFIVTGIAMAIAGLVSALGMQPWTMEVNLVPGAVAGIVAIIIIGTIFAYAFYLQGVKDCGPVKASLVGCLEPISATVLSALWLGTQFSLQDLLGCGLIIAMMFMLVSSDQTKEGAGDSTRGVGHQQTSSALSPLFTGDNPASTLSFTQAQTPDAARCLEILSASRRSLKDAGFKLGIKPYPSVQRFKRALDAGFVWCAKDESGLIVGLVCLDESFDKSYELGPGFWQQDSNSVLVLRWLSVDPAWRRRKVASFLLRACIDQACARDFDFLRTDTYQNNEPMNRLLESFGFIPCGEIVISSHFEGPRKRSAYELMLEPSVLD